MPDRRAPIRRGRRGGVDVRLPEELRSFLVGLARELRELHTGDAAGDDPGLGRLYPSASAEDPMAALAFDELTHDELARDRLDALAVLERTAEASHLDDEEADAWLRTLNDARLVLGTRLGVTEEASPEDFDADPETRQTFEVYSVLSAIVDLLIDALGEPPVSDGG
jgi:hypothetical protein